jgi:hypothetical protein
MGKEKNKAWILWEATVKPLACKNTNFSLNKKWVRANRMAQVVEHLPSKGWGPLLVLFSTTKKEKKERNGQKHSNLSIIKAFTERLWDGSTICFISLSLSLSIYLSMWRKHNETHQTLFERGESGRRVMEVKWEGWTCPLYSCTGFSQWNPLQLLMYDNWNIKWKC